jgi:hypothetical protein
MNLAPPRLRPLGLLVLGVTLAGCGADTPPPAAPVAPTPVTATSSAAAPAPTAAPSSAPTSSAVAPPAAPSAAAACTEGAVRCEGIYLGKVKAGNNKPAGARAMECKAGEWVPTESCDSTKNMGCYVVDDPALGHDAARCLSTFSRGE